MIFQLYSNDIPNIFQLYSNYSSNSIPIIFQLLDILYPKFIFYNIPNLYSNIFPLYSNDILIIGYIPIIQIPSKSLLGSLSFLLHGCQLRLLQALPRGHGQKLPVFIGKTGGNWINML